MYAITIEHKKFCTRGRQYFSMLAFPSPVMFLDGGWGGCTGRGLLTARVWLTACVAGCKLVVLCTVPSQYSLGSGGVAQRLEAHTIAQ